MANINDMSTTYDANGDPEPAKYTDYYQDNIAESNLKAKNSDYKLPRSISNDKVYFQ